MVVMFYCVTLCLTLPSLVMCSLNRDLLESKYPIRFRSIVNSNNLNTTDYSDGYRLPTNLKPTSYDLLFNPFLSNGTFRGQAIITFNVINSTNEIVLNARFAYIRADSMNVMVKINNKTSVTVTNTTIDEEHQMVRFKLDKPLKSKKEVVITIEYDGILATDMMGFYLSTFNTTDSYGLLTEHLMAITQFEGTFARRAFPCFDEPAYRANFTISILRSPNQTSMSNMELASSTNVSELVVLDVYETSPAMPTYLVAFGVSDFSWVSDGGNVRVATRPSVIKDTAFAVAIGQPILDSIGNFTKVPYPLKKMDIVAVPDFSAGAMENWGLTTFREKYVVYNSEKNTNNDKYGVLSVVAHEFGHQWFGDLVTPQWWDFTWLNEAFATYFEYITPNQLYPEWNIGSTMYIKALQSALDSDVGDPRPMTSPVFTPEQIEGIFDYVIYEKGGSVLRMIESFLTTPVWRDGLYRYLTENAYGTGTPDELFSSLKAAAEAVNSSVAPLVKETLTGWTTQPGYPLVKLQKQSDSVFLVTQSPYELNVSNMTWYIPLTYTTQEEAQFDANKAARMLLTTSSDTVSINTNGWVILNIDQIGYFRVNYEDENWQKIINQLKSNHIGIERINRAQLLDDAYHLAKTGHLNFSTYMDLTLYLPKETDHAPWHSFFTNTRFLLNQFYNTPTGDDLLKYARNIMISPFQTLTSTLEGSRLPFLDSMTLMAAVQFSCEIQLPDCQQLASTAFEKWSQDPYSISTEIRQAVICTQLREDSSGKSFQPVLDYFLKSDNGKEQLNLIYAMGCVTNKDAFEMYMNVICDVTANHVRLQDRFIAVRALLSHQSGIIPGLQYLINNYDKVSQALGKRFNSVFSTLGGMISQDAHIAQVKRLVNDTTVDKRIREKLATLVLPPVTKRQTWAQSPQATQLKNWVQSDTKSSASCFSIHATFIMLLSFYVTMEIRTL